MAEQQNRVPFGPEISQILHAMLSDPPEISKDVFLPELIRDSLRVLKRMRIEGLIDERRLRAEPNLFIKIVPDEKSKTLSIIDSGPGMSRDELVELGTMSEGLEIDMYRRILDGYLDSDDPEFVQKRMADVEKICGSGSVPTPHMPDDGCFGFYSAYWVAEKVVVTTKNSEEEAVQYVWESQVTKEDGGSYTVTEDTSSSNEQLTRGTKVTLFLKEDELEYLKEDKLKDMVDKYCGFCIYPISILGFEKKKDAAEDKQQQINNVDDDKKKKEEFECLRNIMKDILANRVKDVVVSDRFNDLDSFMTVDMVLNINPTSPIIEDMRKKAEANKDDESLFVKVHMMYDSCHDDMIRYDIKYNTDYYKPVAVVGLPSLRAH